MKKARYRLEIEIGTKSTTTRTIVNEKDAFGRGGGDILGLRAELHCG